MDRLDHRALHKRGPAYTEKGRRESKFIPSDLRNVRRGEEDEGGQSVFLLLALSAAASL